MHLLWNAPNCSQLSMTTSVIDKKHSTQLILTRSSVGPFQMTVSMWGHFWILRCLALKKKFILVVLQLSIISSAASLWACVLIVSELRVVEAHEQAPVTVRSLKRLLPPRRQYVQHCVSERTHLWIWPRYLFTAYGITFGRLKQKSRHCDSAKTSEPQMKWI